jgi:hypothetical protein
MGLAGNALLARPAGLEESALALRGQLRLQQPQLAAGPLAEFLIEESCFCHKSLARTKSKVNPAGQLSMAVMNVPDMWSCHVR